MPFPTITKTWTISPGTTITGGVLLTVSQGYLHAIKTFLKANGYTVKGSASAGTGAMDAVDRWTLTTDVTPRATTGAASQAWMVLVDGNGAEILLSFQGASDDIFRVSIAVDGTGFAAAGTPSHIPTSSNEQVVSSTISMIGSTAAGDRRWFGWVDSEHKLCRFAIAQAGNYTGRMWGVERINPVNVSPSVIAIPVWGFAFMNGAPGSMNIMRGAANVGVLRAVVSSVTRLCAVMLGAEEFSETFCDNVKTPQQGAVGYLMRPIVCGTTTTSGEGKLGDVYDQWFSQTNTSSAISGDVTPGKEFICMGVAGNGRGHLWWPWNGITSPVLS